jgi:hypothetical protein
MQCIGIPQFVQVTREYGELMNHVQLSTNNYSVYSFALLSTHSSGQSRQQHLADQL